MPGLTRDRQYVLCHAGQTPCVLVDTGGIVSQADGIEYLTAKQVRIAIDEAALVLFVVSAADGLTTEDENVAQVLRQSSKPVLLVANKSDAADTDIALPDFASLGMGAVAAACAALGGRVEVESEPGQGTCVRLLLPLADNVRPLRPTAPPPDAPGAGRARAAGVSGA
jgi:GTP-binding protein